MEKLTLLLGQSAVTKTTTNTSRSAQILGRERLQVERREQGGVNINVQIDGVTGDLHSRLERDELLDTQVLEVWASTTLANR
jgi:hypothetical protein